MNVVPENIYRESRAGKLITSKDHGKVPQYSSFASINAISSSKRISYHVLYGNGDFEQFYCGKLPIKFKKSSFLEKCVDFDNLNLKRT